LVKERIESEDEESVLTRTEGTEIHWTSLEKNVTKKTITRRQRNRRTFFIINGYSHFPLLPIQELIKREL
jgi:hypothetical protein